MTPLQLQVLIHSYITTSWKGMEHLRDGNPTWKQQTKELFDNGMIEENNKVPLDCFLYTITEKGAFWLKHILAIPFPVTEWKIPNDQP